MDIHTGNGAWRRSSVHPHRSNTQGRDWVCRPVSRSDRPAGTRMLHNRWLALTFAIHRASSGCHGGYPLQIRQNRPATRAPSPLKTTALRVIRRAGYPHGGNPPSDSGCAPRKALRAGIPCRKGLIGRSSADAHRRSASSDPRCKISTWARIRRAMVGARERHRAGIPCWKGLIGRSSADTHRRGASSDPGRRISTWTRICRAMVGARERHRAGIPCRKGLIGRSSADAHRRSASSDRERRISTSARIRRAMTGSPEAPPRRHSVPEAAHRPVER